MSHFFLFLYDRTAVLLDDSNWKYKNDVVSIENFFVDKIIYTIFCGTSIKDFYKCKSNFTYHIIFQVKL